MRPLTSPTLLALLALPLLTAAQSSSGSGGAPSQTVITSTSLSTFVTLGPDRQISTGTRTIVVTTTQLNNDSTASGSNTASLTSTGNSTNSHSSTQTPSNLPTAPTTIAAGGGTAGAPLPGATGGAYGPDDGYIAAALSLQRNTLLVGLGGLVVGGALIVL
ncbi:hypothetical protein D9615_010669 [Tricholomella constricta]|uniref:Uncharacterized protein n=1 Tax=Tricholomella constricta TaxID=117010 RepID=A0A8H5LRZ5_9AGAR|nr:hypothetical protein D9615_010669 [Tricholomella constricta]